MKILFLGDLRSNCGPANVNKKLAEAFSPNFVLVHSQSKILKAAELLWKVLTSQVVVISALTGMGQVALRLACVLKKPVVYLMHGDAAHEGEINGELGNTQRLMAWEMEMLEKATLLLPVSKRFSLWVKERYPQYAAKIEYLYNGVETPAVKMEHDTSGGCWIAAVGGDRKTKNNAVLAQAVQAMEGTQLHIYGKMMHPEKAEHSERVIYQGLRSPQELYEGLSKSEVFVLNSVFEPFSLSVIDALNCGCSVLVSECAGIVDLLALEETDIIHNTMDVQEIREKIAWLLEHPNNQRIVKVLDYSRLSYEVRARELEQRCRELVAKQ